MKYWVLAATVVLATSPGGTADEPQRSPGEGRFLRLFWFEPGVEHGNPVTNRRFRVNDRLAALHPEFGMRSETRGNGMMQIELTEPLAGLRAAELALELWGGHPGTANKRVTVNGRGSYAVAEVGTAAGHCTHQYPVIPLDRADLVQAHNAFQFSCERGTSFWGHFIVDNACLRVELAPGHPTLQKAGLDGFTARVVVTPGAGESLVAALDVADRFRGRVAGVDFQAFYDGFDENGDGRARDWHGMTRKRAAYGHLGTAATDPFRLAWDTRLLLDQKDLAVRAVVRFKDRPDLHYVTPASPAGPTPPRVGRVLRFAPADLPKPFWSRAGAARSSVLTLDVDPATLESAEVRVVLWDGGVDKTTEPLTLNGKPLAFRSDGRHDVQYLRLPVAPATLVRGKNTFTVLSDTTHHGIEVLLPGPELWVRTAALKAPAGGADPDEQRRAAMNSKGDPAKGKTLFASERLRCLTCHTAGGLGQGAAVGPDLTLVAGKLDRTHLVESLLDPSAQVPEGYRTTVVALKDGRTLTGVVANRTADGFTLTEAVNRSHEVRLADVEEEQTSPVSLMPADLCVGLTPAEFTDLVAYLETLRAGGRKPTPGEGVTGAVTLPPGFTVEPVANGLTGATALTVLPDGRVLVGEQSGALRVVQKDRLLPEPFATLPVQFVWERGLLGVTAAPNFPATPHVFVCYVAAKPHPHHVISRLTVDGERAVPGSEVVLFEGDDQGQLGGFKPDGHQGGPIHFGKDGKLYVALGDGTAGQPAQSLQSLQGKILRLNADGSIPDDNPFARQATGKYRAIWALGCRNPFGLAFQPGTGRLFLNDVGGRAEEVNEGRPGANYGWPTVEHGPTADARFRGPIHHYPTACITGGAFAPPDSAWPAEYRGRYFYADFNHGVLRTLDPNTPARATGFASGLRRPVDLRFAPNGDLYVLVRDAWVVDQHFHPGTGSLLRLRAPAN